MSLAYVTLKNIIPNSSFETDSDWGGIVYDNTVSLFGARSQHLPVGTYVSTCPMPVPIVGHIYYGRHYLKSDGNGTAPDCRFEWHGGDGEGLNWVFGWNRGNYPTWAMESAVHTIAAVNATEFVCRHFVVENNVNFWADGLMIVDLTAAFGVGNEPSKEWLDENIPYFTDEYSLFYGELELITDRTQTDIDRVKQLAAKGWQNMTEAEKAEWIGELKGAYNASDLNRVESAAKYLSELLAELPDALRAYAEQRGVHWDAFFDVPYDATAYGVTVKTDWVMSDIPTPSDMVRYLANVVLLRNALQHATADLPSDMDNLTYAEANAIEQALKGLDEAIATLQDATERYIDNTAAAWFYSGEIYAGEVTA